MFPGGSFPHGFTFEFDTIGIVNEPVKDGIGKRRISDDLVPMFDRELTGDDGGSSVVPIFENLEKITALHFGESGKPPVVDYQHMRSYQGAHDF